MINRELMRGDTLWRRNLTDPRGYIKALLIVGAAIPVRVLLGPTLAPSDFAVFLAAIMGAAWVGGLGPCLVVQTLILFIEATWFREPREEPWALSTRAVVSISTYYGVGIAIALLSDLRRASQRRLEAQKDDALTQREQFRATISCIGDGVLVTDSRGRLTLMNPAAEAMTGWSTGETFGLPLSEVFAVQDEPSMQVAADPVVRVLRKGSTVHESTPLVMTTKTGDRRPITYSAAPIFDPEGGVSGVAVVFRDETARLETEQTLRDADRRKDEFLATLAHELRNPLAPICMGIELIKRTADDPQATAEIHSMMERQAQHMVRLIDDLLDVSRITRGKLELRKSPVEFSDVVRNAVEATRPMLEQADHQLTIRLPDRPVRLEADPNRLTQVLSNLLNNAAKYTKNGGQIELTARESDGQIEIAVADNGVGIPADKMDYVFGMFSQINDSAENGHTGLGIGLTLVKRLIEMHGGTVAVESAGRGLGSRFVVRLPALRDVAEERMPLRPAKTAADRHRRRVLVVDDNQDALATLAMMAELMGSDVRKASDGVAALQAAESFRPEIVLMDLGMPTLNGYDAARRLRKEHWGREMILVATTGWDQEEDRRRTKEAGFDHHLVKPVSPTKLQELLQCVAPAQTRARGNPATQEEHGSCTATMMDDAEAAGAAGAT